MGLRERLKPRIQDFAMRFMDELRPETVAAAQGSVLEVGFGTARNLEHYGAGVGQLTGLDPMRTEGIGVVEERTARARFPVERTPRGRGPTPALRSPEPLSQQLRPKKERPMTTPLSLGPTALAR